MSVVYRILLSCATLACCAAATSTSVKVDAVPLHSELEEGQSAEQSVMFRINVPQLTGMEPPQERDLVIVLDVSGSMSGAKLNTAKAAIASVIESMRATDRLHLVTYDSDARNYFTGGQTKAQLLKQVAALRTGGATNLYAGLAEVEPILRDESDRRSTKRIFLFSDGLVNVGVTDHSSILRKVERLRQQGASTSAFGIGADYDANLMSAIAEAGHGEFFFISGQKDMERVVEVAAAGFRGLFGTDAELRLTPFSGAEVLEVYNQHFRVEQSDDGSGGVSVITLGDLRNGESRTVLVDLHLPRMVAGITKFLKYELTYAAVGTSSGAVQVQHGHVPIRVVHGGAPIASAEPSVVYFRRLQQLLITEKDIEDQIRSGDAQVAADMEEQLEKGLGDLSHSCIQELKTEPICGRAQAAHARTKKSNMFMQEAFGDRAQMSNAYSFKRQLNAQLSESYDEL